MQKKNRIQTELVENGNGEAIFDFDKITVFGAIVNNALELLLAKLNIERKVFFVNYKENQAADKIDPTDNVLDVLNNVPDNVTDVTDNVTDKRMQLVLNLILQNNKIGIQEISTQLLVSKRTVMRDIEKLKTQNKIKRVGSEKSGYWEVIL